MKFDKKKAVGFISIHMGMSEPFYRDIFKLALLWFDDLISEYELVVKGMPRMLAEGGVRHDLAKIICDTIHPVEELIPGYKDDSQKLLRKDSYLTKAAQSTLTQFIANLTDDNGSYYQRWQFDDQNAYLLADDVIRSLRLLSKLSKKVDCCMLPTVFEHRVLVEITKTPDYKSSFDLFREVAQYRLPKLGNLDWEGLLELRHHNYLVNFRKTIAELQEQLRLNPSTDLNELFVEIERKHLKELLSLLKPSPLQSTVKGIITNLPLPIPLNPVSLYDAIKTARRDKMIAKRYGWLYFLYELD